MHRRDADEHIELGAGKASLTRSSFYAHDPEQLRSVPSSAPSMRGMVLLEDRVAAGALRLARLAGEDADHRAGVQLDQGAGDRVQGSLDLGGGVALGGEGAVLALQPIEGDRLPRGDKRTNSGRRAAASRRSTGRPPKWPTSS